MGSDHQLVDGATASVSDQTVLAEGRGFRIAAATAGTASDAASASVLSFEDKNTRGPLLVTFISGGVALVLLLSGVALGAQALSGAAPPGLGVGAAVAATLGVLAALLSRRALRSYQKRASSGGVQHTLRQGALWDAAGQKLAPASALSLSVHIDWTDGMGGLRLMRVLRLRWPGGSVVLFRTYDRAELDRLVAALSARGLKKA